MYSESFLVNKKWIINSDIRWCFYIQIPVRRVLRVRGFTTIEQLNKQLKRLQIRCYTLFSPFTLTFITYVFQTSLILQNDHFICENIALNRVYKIEHLIINEAVGRPGTNFQNYSLH